jgi:hypothetical protein
MNGESDVPLPVPYSLEAADGRFAASSDAVSVVVVELLFVVDATELTLTGVSIGWVIEVLEVTVDVVGGVTPEERPFAPVDSAAADAAADGNGAAELVPPVVLGGGVTFEATVPPDVAAPEDVVPVAPVAPPAPPELAGDVPPEATVPA